MLASVFRRIFPPFDEMSVFVITTTFLSLFFYMEGWALAGVKLFSEFMLSLVQEIKGAVTIGDAIKAFFTLVFSPFFIIAMLFGPLVLPFTKADLRDFCPPIIIIDLSIIAYHNLQINNDHATLLNSLIAAYSITWILYVTIALRLKKIEALVDDDQADAHSSCIAALISIISVFLSIKLFDVHWLQAYCTGSLITPPAFNYALKLYKNILSKKKTTREIKGVGDNRCTKN